MSNVKKIEKVTQTKPNNKKKKKGANAKKIAGEAAKIVFTEGVKAAARAGANAILHNHSKWWELAAKLHTGINFNRPTKVFSNGGDQPQVEITNVNSVFTYPLNTIDEEIDSELIAIANQVIKQIRLDLRSNLNYSVTDVAKYLQISNGLNIEFENIIKLLRLTMSANTKVQNFSKLATSTFKTNEMEPLVTADDMFADEDVSDYLSRLIRMLTDVRGIVLPKSLYERNNWLFGNIFTDETNLAKTQYYTNYVTGEVDVQSNGELIMNSTTELVNSEKFFYEQGISHRMKSLENLVKYAVGTGSAIFNFGTIAADLEKSAIETIDLGTGCFDKVNTLTPINPIYDSTYFRALDNTPHLDSLFASNVFENSTSDAVIVDVDSSNTDASAIASAIQFTWGSDLTQTQVMNKLSRGKWISDNGWLQPLGCYGLAATVNNDVAIMFRPALILTIVPDQTLTSAQCYALALMATVDHYMYPKFNVYSEGVGAMTNVVYMKEISLRAQINNLVLRDIKYMANLGLVINAKLA